MSLIAGTLGISSVRDPDHKTLMVTVNSRDSICMFSFEFSQYFLSQFSVAIREYQSQGDL